VVEHITKGSQQCSSVSEQYATAVP
jgi:hypothetical protein